MITFKKYYKVANQDQENLSENIFLCKKEVSSLLDSI